MVLVQLLNFQQFLLLCNVSFMCAIFFDHEYVARLKPIGQVLWQCDQIRIEKLNELLVFKLGLDGRSLVFVLLQVISAPLKYTLSMIDVMLQFWSLRRHPTTVPVM